jgi:hypothetical protein
VTGSISFNEHRDPVKSVVVMEIRDGKRFYNKSMD